MRQLRYGDTVRFDGKEYTVRVHYDQPGPDGWEPSDMVKITRNGFPKYVERDKLKVVA